MRIFSLIMVILAVLLYACKEKKTGSPAQVSVQYPAPLPDSTAEKFLPGLVCSKELDFNAALSNDGKTFYFSRSRNRKYIIYESKFDGTKWNEPVVSGLFDTTYSNTDPFITTNGDIYFISNRPKNNADTTDDYDIYRIKPADDGIAPAENLAAINSDSTEYYVSLSRSGTIYFASYREGNLDLYMSQLQDTGYQQPVNLGKIINSDWDEHDPLIAPDESWLVFTSSRPGGMGEADLYIARRKNNQWEQPQNMGKKINTPTYEYCPNLSPDGKYFFFSSEMDVKWISSLVLTE